MWTYETDVNWTEGKQGTAQAANKAPIPLSTPPEFGGPDGFWTPEDLLANAVASCIMTSALFFIDRAGVELQSYRSRAKAVMEKTGGGLVITAIHVEIQAQAKQPEQAEALKKAIEQAEKTCPVSALLKCPVELSVTVK